MKKLWSFVLVLALVCAVAMPNAYAAQEGDSNVEGSVAIDHEQSYSDAYISFSDALYDLGVTVNTCYEDFVDNYDASSGSLDEYVEEMISAEISMYNAGPTSSRSSIEIEDQDYADAVDDRAAGVLSDADAEMLQEYESLMSNFRNEGYNVYLPYEAFAEVYISGEDIEVQPRSVTSRWYDNIGDDENPPSLPQAADYSDYNLLSKVQKGDIVQETDGGIAYYTGHIAIIQGKYYDSGYQQYYLRTIESGMSGVVYGVLDDSRYDYRGVNVYYVTSASQTNKNAAVTFCYNQLGKPYDYAAVLTGIGNCKTSSDAESWYCSELVWAAYYNQGINLNGSTIPANIYLPITMAGSSKLTKRTIS